LIPDIKGEGDRLRVFANRLLRGIFEPQKAEVTGGWIKLHNELHEECRLLGCYAMWLL
jgi:hypothetical protein